MVTLTVRNDLEGVSVSQIGLTVRNVAAVTLTVTFASEQSPWRTAVSWLLCPLCTSCFYCFNISNFVLLIYGAC